MSESLTDRLCTHCALCCDGSLFADVELAGAKEATSLEVMGLAVDDSDADGPLLLLPCRALRGTRCGIYAQRPGCCRTFECGLLQNVRRGEVGIVQAEEYIAEALARVARVKELLSDLGQRQSPLPLKERVAEALARATVSSDRKRAALESAMTGLERLIARTFLGNGSARATGGRPAPR